MGNSTSSSRLPHDDTVDYGHLHPQGVYSGHRDWNESVVGQLIVERKLAPFYRPLEDYEDSWDDEKILAARKEPPATPAADGDGQHHLQPPRVDPPPPASRHSHKRSAIAKEPPRNPEAAVYRGAVECPICFLYYPPNINRSRCCDQAICTECFVQIKRSEPTVTHLQSDPACCPYCVQEHFGVVYNPPSWRAGLGSEGSMLPPWPDTSSRSQSVPPSLGKQRRRKSLGANDPDVVTIDQIRPDWEAKLQAVRAQAARRANRRIIMRQVGDRLIPVGVTSGRVHTISAELGADAPENGGSNNGSSRRSRRRQQNELQQLLGGMAGQDLEELMIMEAMRLSLLEHEEHQRREREAQERAQNGGEGSSDNAPAVAPATEGGGSDSSASTSPASTTTPSVIQQSNPSPPSSSSPAISAPTLTERSATEESGIPLTARSAQATPRSSTPANPVSHTSDVVDEAGSHAEAVHTENPVNGDAAPAAASTSESPRPLPTRTDTTTTSMTEESTDSRSETGYSPLSSESEESVVAHAPLLQDGSVKDLPSNSA